MWRTLAAGDFVSKDAAADWVMPLLPGRRAALIRQAKLQYLGLGDMDWTSDRQQVRRVADDLATPVAALL
ncbi:aminoglycoside nucleotidyltransferase ANT9 [Pseudorhizobium endolithicum]|uniref:Aminoglycoside nucleotidyltransferase ANT9 n=2 Tax=Pseudorhizobium endolithicum TaxID=1191678 RepID=A0ABN7JJL7_9HYPH|nr:aminoglycoside nucleotidyltransferase ANT9 [Pseudorhizobium endolithicum]